MGERLVPLSRTKLIRRFKDLGWSRPHRGRRHDTMYKEGRRPLTIPNNHSGDVSKGLPMCCHSSDSVLICPLPMALVCCAANGRSRAMAGVIFELISADEQWEIFDDAARRLLDIDGLEFARRWDNGEFLNRDEPGVMQVAILRPHGWPVAP